MRSITVKRVHGLGNVIMLLPVLNQLARLGADVCLVTQSEWIDALQELNPAISFSDRDRNDAVDLDLATRDLVPREHRGKEFAGILNVTDPIEPARFAVPVSWSDPFTQWQGAIGFAPEAGHPSRQWPAEYCHELASSLCSSPLILLGMRATPLLPCDLDTRGRLSLKEVFGLLSVLRLLICFDSGMMHLGASVDVATICIFGGINPKFRIHDTQNVIALQSTLECCPCNKRETCEGRYDCITSVKPQDVLQAMAHHAVVRQVQAHV